MPNFHSTSPDLTKVHTRGRQIPHGQAGLSFSGQITLHTLGWQLEGIAAVAGRSGGPCPGIYGLMNNDFTFIWKKQGWQISNSVCLLALFPFRTTTSRGILNSKEMDVSLWPRSWGFLSKVTWKKCESGLPSPYSPILSHCAWLHHSLPISRSVFTSWPLERKNELIVFHEKPDLVSSPRLSVRTQRWMIFPLAESIHGRAADSLLGVCVLLARALWLGQWQLAVLNFLEGY